MDRVAARRARHRDAAELDVTPFMNLMIVLVPVLLLTLVFTHTTVIDLNFPSSSSDSEFDPDQVHLEVVITETGMVVADGRGGTIKTLPRDGDAYNFADLSLVMQELKRRMPEKRDITLLLGPDVEYQTLVTTMDTVRAYPTVQALEVVQAELFPVISLGDSPVPGDTSDTPAFSSTGSPMAGRS